MTTGRSDYWSQERVDELKALYADETLSLDVIRKKMGLSKGALTGKLKRLGLTGSRSTHPKGGRNSWPQADLDRLTSLWTGDETYSITEIAVKMDKSRSAIAGALKRLGLPKRGRPSSPNRMVRLSKPRRSADIIALPRKTRAQEFAERFPAPEIHIEPLRISFMQLTDSTCKFECSPPEQDDPSQFVFCGHPPAKEQPYCAAHCRIAYAPPPPPSQRSKPRLDLGNHRGGVFGRVA